MVDTPERDECATEGCHRAATEYFERGGVGSRYCADCATLVRQLSHPMTPKEVEDVVGRLLQIIKDDADEQMLADHYIALSEAASLLRTQAERIAELERALEPFSKFDTGPAVDDGIFFLHDEHPLLGEGLGDDWKPAITVSHFRRARSVLEGK